MKIGCQEGLLPGKNVFEKFEIAKEIGFEGIEIWGKELLENTEKIKEYKKVSEKIGIKISSICAGYRNLLLEAEPENREKAREDIKKLLEIGKDLGAVGLILVPIFGGPRVPNLSPYKNAYELERELLLSQLPEIVEKAEETKCCILLEPLNRYETHFLNRLEQAVEYCEKIKNPYLKIMADFFHMNIEEANIAEAIKKAGKYIAHIHLADSNRILPGFGHTDFESGFKALKEIGFENYMILECGVPEPRRENLERTLKFMKEILRKI
ncbi:MAG: sugar phosphate isomerase/epimerase [bacterium]|nr:sugar phosphate isomerase/epimerase [bacterium]MCX7917642.1 sugar phosphate isomerase/epimerase [bacterium]MDW8163301.1 sugar phosphate isomerase/epimerase [Candidatus Omnitrophota bacterium]